MAKVTDPLTLDEIRKIEVLLEIELSRVKREVKDDKKQLEKCLEIGMIKGKLNHIKKDYFKDEDYI